MARREHRKRKHPSERSFFDSYWFEITIAGLIALGIFLLLERLEIKAAIWQALVWSARRVGDIARSLGRSGVRLFNQIDETSDLVGIALILAAAALVAAKLRLRAIRRHPPLPQCPRCSAVLQRVHGGLIRRLLGLALWVRIRHYACDECGFRATVWSGRRE